MKCKDCGAREYKPSSRSDVCVSCMDLRLRLMQAVKSGSVTVDQFKSVQRTMNTDIFRHGRAAKKMRKLIG